METLTEKQKRVLEFIESYSFKNDRSPTFEEIQKHFGYKSIGTVHDFITTLKLKGYIEKSTRKWNGLELSKETNKVPLLGKVAAGRPIQYHKYNEKLEIPMHMLSGTGRFFALQVLGDSMIDEGILEDDYVVIKEQETAENGQVVVAMVDNEATIKRFYKKKGMIELHSANEKYKPLKG